MKMYKRKAKKISYGRKRKLSDIKYIVIHYTGNKDDTSKNNVDYFATGNTRQAGAHFFVDKQGKIGRSIPMNRVAYSVGGKYSTTGGAGSHYGYCTNDNSVSIELCDLIGETNWEQMIATRKLIRYIRKKCPNANNIIRHWDVNGKSCPSTMAGVGNEKWVEFRRFITVGYSIDAVVTKKCSVYGKASNNPLYRIGFIKKGEKIKIHSFSGNYAKIQRESENEMYKWISIDNIKEI